MKSRGVTRNKRIEHKIENDFVLYARTLGVSSVKFEDKSQVGAPDQIVLCPNAHVFFIEFKKPGEKADPIQEWYHDCLRNLGFRVYTIDNLDEACSTLRKEFDLCTMNSLIF